MGLGGALFAQDRLPGALYFQRAAVDPAAVDGRGGRARQPARARSSARSSSRCCRWRSGRRATRCRAWLGQLAGVFGKTAGNATFVTADRFVKQPGLKPCIFWLILVLFILFEPLGIYGRWLKIRIFFSTFPLDKHATFRRQKTYMRPERWRCTLLAAGRAADQRRHQGARRRELHGGARQVFTIIGPNGAGKTTIFNLISRIYDSTAGRLSFAGEDITGSRRTNIARRGDRAHLPATSSCSSTPRCCKTDCWVATATGGRASWRSPPSCCGVSNKPAHREAVEKVIDFLDLQPHRYSLIANLSYGVRKVVEMARALAHRAAKLLLLDEPSSASAWRTTAGHGVLDPGHPEPARHHRADGRAQHQPVGTVSDRVLALNYGRPIAMGTAREVQEHPDVIRRTWKAEGWPNSCATRSGDLRRAGHGHPRGVSFGGAAREDRDHPGYARARRPSSRPCPA